MLIHVIQSSVYKDFMYMCNCRFGQNIMSRDAEFSDAYNNYMVLRLCITNLVSFTEGFTLEN